MSSSKSATAVDTSDERKKSNIERNSIPIYSNASVELSDDSLSTTQSSSTLKPGSTLRDTPTK